ncbi:MAG: hypothetical protein IJE84_03425, partial [Clostridia bacterium]|nr:hypothetical protein [Clostridia bacterium]
MKKYIKLYSFLLFAVIISLCCYVGASAEELTWTDAGAYNESWLGEYDKTTEYKINTKEDLAAFLVASKGKYSFENKTVKICSDIDMSDRLWVSAFSSKTAFCGVLDGQGHIISGIRISPDQSEGAFLAKNKGSVTDLCLNVTSSSAKNAGVAIHNEGKIQNVAVSGKLGLEVSVVSAGITTKNDGIVENCYSIAQIIVKEGSYSGGICI